MNGNAAGIRLLDLSRLRVFFKDPTRQNTLVGICSEEEFHFILGREKARADRNGHGFSLVAIEVQSPADLPFLTEHLLKRIRTTDEIGWFADNTLGVFLYNTSALGAWQFVNNSSKNTGDDFSISECSVYSYPNEWCGF
jgi:hypothetical protein